MKCPHCQAENPETKKFCGECGKKLIQVCSKCGAQNPPSNKFCGECGHSFLESTPISESSKPSAPAVPTSFANGRYQVKKFLGEGGKKKVYLAHDTVLDRDVAFALIKTEKLDETGKTRIKREVQAMGKLGDHHNIVTVYDFGDHEGQPFIVLPLISGGDVEGLIKKAPDHKLPLDKAIEIAESVCKGLEFAHARGIIHRDIKPGNIWMSADGTAKIGDFGLAIAVEHSRLTKSGMMVGTVAYMPPEQAMGGKVTAKADLYSLGAMLYEMVTGRPPFVGDDSVSIIGQHINTSPVSPAWHRADLPPALETLIMQLLEKDPEKRPGSATVVLQALEAIKAGKAKKEPAKETATGENPLYRRVFVGREPELKQLQSSFDGAMSGQGALMMVMGEPGIGKTALCEQLSTYVTLRGGRTLLGHCYEEGSLSLPYLAFVEAMRSYVLIREVKDLREELGTGAADVARIVSEIRERLKVKPGTRKDPEEEKYRLMQAVTNFLTNAACVQPLLIVLEDLHDADKGTLDMLTHLSRHLAGARLLIVGTYRDVEVDRSHPLSAALAELRRVSTYGRVVLRGLNPDEVRRMLESITRESVPWGLAEAVHRQTEGNPLFVQEVVRFLVEDGLITQKDGRWRPVKDTPLEMNIPEGLRDVIGKRLSLISKQCNQLLSVASVIGRDFSLEVLKKVSGLSEEELFSALGEAKKAAIIEERAGMGAKVSYRFAHAFFRQTLYEELIAPRRIRLHQQVARALEEIYASRLEEHAVELAEHFSHSSDSADLKKAVSYGEMAAKRATDVYAYGEAVRLLDQTIKVQEILDPNDKVKRCNLALDLCSALLYIPNASRVFDTEALVAFRLAEEIGDSSKASKACEIAYTTAVILYGIQAMNDKRLVEWVKRAEQHAKPGTLEGALSDMLSGFLIVSTNEDYGPGLKLIIQAMNVARQLRAYDYFWEGACVTLLHRSGPQDVDENRRLVEELWATYTSTSKLGIGSYYLNTGLFNIGASFLSLGQREGAEVAWSELRRISHLYEDQISIVMSLGMDAIIALMDGRFEDVRKIIGEMHSLKGERNLSGVIAIFSGFPKVRMQLYLGDSLDTLERETPRGVATFVAELCLVQSHVGRKQEVSRILEEQVIKRPNFNTTEDHTPSWKDVLFLEAAVLVGHHQATELLLKRWENSGLYTPAPNFPTCIDRHLGGAASLLGRQDESRKHYMSAIKKCAEIRFRPELALTHLQLAELLLEHYPAEKKEALEHLDFAIKEFREMKMQPSLERALRHKDILKA